MFYLALLFIFNSWHTVMGVLHLGVAVLPHYSRNNCFRHLLTSNIPNIY
jgi:hypothetical protein